MEIERKFKVRQLPQQRFSQQQGGNCIEHNMKSPQLSIQLIGSQRPAAKCLRPCPILPFSSRRRDVRTESAKPMCQQFSDSAVAQHQSLRSSKDDRHLLHGNLNGTFCCGNRVCHCKLLAGQIIQQRHSCFLRLMRLSILHLTRQYQLIRAQLSEQLPGFQLLFLAIQNACLPTQGQR